MESQLIDKSVDVPRDRVSKDEDQTTLQPRTSANIRASDENMQLILLHVQKLAARPRGLCQGS